MPTCMHHRKFAINHCNYSDAATMQQRCSRRKAKKIVRVGRNNANCAYLGDVIVARCALLVVLLFIREMGQPLIIIRSTDRALCEAQHHAYHMCLCVFVRVRALSVYVRASIHIRTAQQTLARNVHCPHNSLARAPDKSHASDCGPPIQVSLLFFFAPQCFCVSTFALREQKTHARIRVGNAVRKYKHASGLTFACVSVVRSATVVVVVVLVIVVTVAVNVGAFKTRQKEFYTGTCHPRCQSLSDGLPLTIHIHSSYNTTTTQYFTSTPLQAMCNRTTRRFIIILGKPTNGDGTDGTVKFMRSLQVNVVSGLETM